ncbi:MULTISPECIES: SRPBCC family protein [Microbacterium]|jgi:hypothetical protein|nr:MULTISPECIES: polyketide cyclase [unclassified Microbacterium]MBN9199160.1 SRPBCC family protein [Microbacterium ginsengisoli]MCK9917402.1 SRPBCC family protein [Microbacteriaceae bacterium K1510]KQR99266.1 polyketide cyclase [Microbacterium sp. Leaf347]KQS02573.1 polyketide cyclase [Microbacterium sp. Leaf351]OJU74927.1 MAG: polyketide cyclase [Microbacterium sp. 71-23]
MTFPVRHISQTIDRDPAIVAEFAGTYENLPRWAAGLSSGVCQHGGRWRTDSPMGEVEVVFTAPVELGILDHDVVFPDGTIVQNSLRVLRNADGAEIVFTLFQHPGVSDEAFEADATAVAADLARLRELLEGDV